MNLDPTTREEEEENVDAGVLLRMITDYLVSKNLKKTATAFVEALATESNNPGNLIELFLGIRNIVLVEEWKNIIRLLFIWMVC